MRKCATCNETQDVNVYCPPCADYAEAAYYVQAREQCISARLQALDWSVTWHGVPAERWCMLSRSNQRGTACMRVTRSGKVLHLQASHVSFDELAAWIDNVVHAWR